ncbi:hypothetical protein EV702DRAFT_1148078 [Suillus placidus]|uniref:Uncharacterized protein n=1 Tax=Suillus placidus TaxID=48579 RepID=A0A9P7CX41_9AGAM|nr:hypothetical protein EV702DRAFT_1148078 [Suillus placidus]
MASTIKCPICSWFFLQQSALFSTASHTCSISSCSPTTLRVNLAAVLRAPATVLLAAAPAVATRRTKHHAQAHA